MHVYTHIRVPMLYMDMCMQEHIYPYIFVKGMNVFITAITPKEKIVSFWKEVSSLPL